MKTKTKNTSIHPAEQEKIILQLREENKSQSLEIMHLKERIELLLAEVYGKKSERFKLLQNNTDQVSIWDGFAEDTSDDQPPEPESTDTPVHVPAHIRKKTGRKPLPPELPRVKKIIDIPEEEKQCACGAFLDHIGEETSEKLDYIPAKLQVIEYTRPKYACQSCEGVETEGSTVKIAPVPKQIIPKSMVTERLLAQIITAKFVDSLPFYRQEKQFIRLGYEISRKNMAKWTIDLSKKVEQLVDLLKQEIRSGPLILMDETPVQVLKEKGRSPNTKSYMWVMCSGDSERPAIHFHYAPTRASSEAQKLLQSYHGIVLTDGYSGYDFIDHSPEMQHAGCWVHSRRKFMEVIKAKGKYQKKKTKSGYAEYAINTIKQLYQIERKADKEELTIEQRLAVRQEQAKPIVDAFRKWLMEIESHIPPKGLLGKAITYTLNQWSQLTLYLDHGIVPLDNNLSENAIRPFVLGRKNWLYCDTVPGAEANARLYSLIETAKANKLNPTSYLNALFEKLPHVENEDQLKSLLPQHIDLTTTELN